MTDHPGEFLLRLALAMVAASIGFAVVLVLGLWFVPLPLVAYVAVLRWGRHVTRWLLEQS